jgi:hypothetical protein
MREICGLRLLAAVKLVKGHITKDAFVVVSSVWQMPSSSGWYGVLL